MVNCSNCGFDAGESRFCPNCGSEIIVEQVNSCPNCGKDVGDSKFCPHCGTKIEKETPKSFCPNCGEEVGDSAFCPSCGTKIQKTEEKAFCPQCGEILDSNAEFCSQCGFSLSKTEKNNESGVTDDLIDFDDKVSGKFSKLLGKSKSMDFVLDKTGSLGYSRISKLGNMSGADRKYYEKIEPVVLEVYDSIDDEYVRAIFIYERSMMANSGSVVGMVASQIYTPTKDMPHHEAVKFYQNMVNKIVSEIHHEKQKGTFDEEEFYKKKVKEYAINSTSLLGISKSLKSFRRNKK